MYNNNMNKVEVSVIMPVYNTGESAKKLIEKILGSFNSLEIIVVNDGSTDDSLNLLKSIKNKKVKVFDKKNGGPSSARNFGIEKAQGKYLLFVDSDDNVEKDFVEKMVKVMDDDILMAVCGVRYCKLDNDSEENVYLDDFPYRENENNKDLMLRSLLHDGRMYPAFNKIFRADIVKNNKLKFDEAMSFGEDTKFVMDYLDNADGQIRFLLEPLYIYYAGTSTSTAKRMQSEWKNWRKCFVNLKKWIGDRPTLEQKKTLGLIYLKWRASWLKAKI